MEGFERTELLIGKDNIAKLRTKHVAIFGIGGVGGYVLEALARTGIENIDIIDNDKISLSNINRQIYALHSTVGLFKVDVAKERCLDINPKIKINTHKVFYLPEKSNQFDFSQYDYIIDAVDTVSAKLSIIKNAYDLNIPVISAMGAGNKLNAFDFKVADIYDTSVCPLAKVMRRELKKCGVEHLKVVYSDEKPRKHINEEYETDGIEKNKIKQIPGSIAFVPSVAGMIIAGEVIKDLINVV